VASSERSWHGTAISVSAGDVLVRFDGTFLRSELAIVESQLAEIFARNARLMAERDGAEAIEFSERPAFDTVGDATLSELVDGQRTLFDARRASLAQEQRNSPNSKARSTARSKGWRRNSPRSAGSWT
jgi:multidrug resistance efflux pump